jgi:hypothetical protein
VTDRVRFLAGRVRDLPPTIAFSAGPKWFLRAEAISSTEAQKSAADVRSATVYPKTETRIDR